MDKGQSTGSGRCDGGWFQHIRTMKTGHRAFRFERNTQLTKNVTKRQNLVEHASRYCASARLIHPGVSWRRVSPRPPPPPSWPLPPSFSCTVHTYTVHAPPPASPHRPQFPRERTTSAFSTPCRPTHPRTDLVHPTRRFWDICTVTPSSQLQDTANGPTVVHGQVPPIPAWVRTAACLY